MNTTKVNSILAKHKETMLESRSAPLSDYDLGFLHGLEYAQALHENRPLIYIDKNKTYSQHDRDKFPEFFL